MTHFSRVLAAVDFSKPARGAFEYALDVSRSHRAELVVVHAVPLNQSLRWRARERVALIARLRQRAEEADVRFKVRVQQGDPAEIIVLHASSLRPDVIVLGTHQRSGIERFRIGSVAERVALKSTEPVLVVPPRPHARATRPFSHLAVAVDFTSASERALETAMALANDPDDRITLLHAVPGYSSGVPPYLYRYGAKEYQDQLRRDAWQQLQRTVHGTGTTAAGIHARVLIGDATTEISDAADEIGADLLVVGVSQRGALSRRLFGATAARLLRVSKVPVLAVPGAGTPSADRGSEPVQLAA